MTSIETLPHTLLEELALPTIDSALAYYNSLGSSTIEESADSAKAELEFDQQVKSIVALEHTSGNTILSAETIVGLDEAEKKHQSNRDLTEKSKHRRKVRDVVGLLRKYNSILNTRYLSSHDRKLLDRRFAEHIMSLIVSGKLGPRKSRKKHRKSTKSKDVVFV